LFPDRESKLKGQKIFKSLREKYKDLSKGLTKNWGDLPAVPDSKGRYKASVEDVIDRIMKTPLAPSDKSEMLRHPKDLTVPESSRVYRRVNIEHTEPIDGGRRRCRVDWKNHAKYRAELRDVDPGAISDEVCDFIDEADFSNNSPLNGEKHPVNNVRMKLPEGVAVVDYDPRKDPVPAEVITTWASVDDQISDISERVASIELNEKKRIEVFLEDFVELMFNENMAKQNPLNVEMDYYVEPAQHGGRTDPSWGAYIDSMWIKKAVTFSIEVEDILEDDDISKEDLYEVLKSWSPQKKFKCYIDTNMGNYEFEFDIEKIHIVGNKVSFICDNFDGTKAGYSDLERHLKNND
jgi:hypothetical protein